MNINKLSTLYDVRKLTKKDIDLIYNLCKNNLIFYKYHPPFVSNDSILNDMYALPPNKSYKDKYYLGYFKNNELIAIIDIITNYPNDSTIFIGFFMTDIRFQHKGISSSIIKDLVSYFKELNYHKIQLKTDKDNPQSNTFWIKNNFIKVNEDKHILMELIL